MSTTMDASLPEARFQEHFVNTYIPSPGTYTALVHINMLSVGRRTREYNSIGFIKPRAFSPRFDKSETFTSVYIVSS